MPKKPQIVAGPKMYKKIIQEGLTYGQAMDAAIHQDFKVTRPIWRGYWHMMDYHTVLGSTRILVAVLRDHAGIDPATPYNEDKLATDWMIVE